VRRHFESGLSGALDVHLALSNVAVAEDLLQDRVNRLSRSKRTLQRLLQRYPDGELETAATLPVLGRAIPAGLPSQLLERRPDIHAAKQRLLAADRRICEAQKAFLPDIRLTGDTGTSSEKLKHVARADYLFWNLMANLTQPLFAGGRLKANLALAESAAQRAWLDYGNIVLTAFQEVESTLTAEHHLIQRLAAVEQAVDQAVAAETLALEAYTAGVADIIAVLESQRRVLDSKADLIRIRRQQLQNRVDIYLALGGGFDRVTEEK
jgi:NodT family efflux transporter outer membrane factor (OMF) lipoprotein